MNERTKIAGELARIARELEADSAYDTMRYFQKAVSNPTPHNVSKFTKSMQPAPKPSRPAPAPKPAPTPAKSSPAPAKSARHDVSGRLAKDLAEIAQEMLDADDEETRKKENEKKAMKMNAKIAMELMRMAKELVARQYTDDEYDYGTGDEEN